MLRHAILNSSGIKPETETRTWQNDCLYSVMEKKHIKHFLKVKTSKSKEKNWSCCSFMSTTYLESTKHFYLDKQKCLCKAGWLLKLWELQGQNYLILF